MKRHSIMIAASLMALSAAAQSKPLTIQIKSTDGQPVKGAIVSVLGAKTTAISDDNGRFTLDADNQQALVTIKAEGFYMRDMSLAYLRNIAADKQGVITLVQDNDPLYSGSVYNHAGEMENSIRSIASSSVESKDFNEKQNLGAALSDGIAGLQVIEKSGMPGEGSYLNVRGIHSLVAENNPLIVVNGTPYFGNQDVSGVINAYSRDLLFGFDPKDIRRVTVLKGADAAMYGSLGSNGVIMIETQQATSDNLSTRMTFSGSYGFNIRQHAIPVLNASQYKDYMKDIGLTLYPSMESLTNDYPFLQNGTYAQSYLFNNNTDWQDDIHRTGFVTENIFRVEGGDEIAKYNISFGYTGNNGTIKGTTTSKYHTNISANVLASRKTDIFANVMLSYITSDLQNSGMQTQTNPLLAAYWANPLTNAYRVQTDGELLSVLAPYDFWNTSSNPTYDYDNVSNPVAIVNSVEAKDKIYDANTQLGINYRWNDYLKLTAMVNLYYNYAEETLFVPGVTNHTIMPQIYGTGLNKVGNGVTTQKVNTYQLSAQYARLFGLVHEFNAYATARMITKSYEVDISEGYNTASDDYKTLDNTQDEKLSFGDNIDWNYFGMNLHADYTYNRTWRATAGVAVDGTSASGTDATRWGYFPSASVTYLMANAGYLPAWIDRLNIQAEASMSGNSRFSPNYGKNYYEGSNHFDIGSITRASLPNTKLEWEKKRQIDLGLDVSMFGNKVSLAFNYFASQGYDLLVNSNVSAVYGSEDYYDNCGKINTSGVEVALRVNPYHTKDWDITLGATLATASSKVKSLGNMSSMTITYTGYNNDDAEMLMQVGETPYQFYGYQTAGIYSTTAQAEAAGLTNSAGSAYQAGDVIFVDQNSDGVIDENDKVMLGSNQPKLYGGINLSVRYKRFVLDANFAYSTGQKVYNATRRQLESMSTFYNQATSVLNRWQVEGQQASLPRASYGDSQGNNIFSDRWLEKGDFLKLRSVKLSYNFDKLLGFIRSGDIYLAAENLFCITDYSGSDPEFAYSYAEELRGFDYAKSSLPVTVKIGFDINF